MLDFNISLQSIVSTSDEMVCNLTCCQSGGNGSVLCFPEYNFTDYYNVTETSEFEMAVRWSYTTIVFLTGFIGNLLIIQILCTNRLLLKASINKFILNMSIADFILICTGPILFTIRDTNDFWVLGEAWCHLEGYVQSKSILQIHN